MIETIAQQSGEMVAGQLTGSRDLTQAAAAYEAAAIEGFGEFARAARRMEGDR